MLGSVYYSCFFFLKKNNHWQAKCEIQEEILKYLLEDMNFSKSYFYSLLVFFAIAELRCLANDTNVSLRNLACLLTVRYSIYQWDGWYDTWVLPRVYIRLSIIQTRCNNCFTIRNTEIFLSTSNISSRMRF